jgi:hypothetical protein
MRSTRTELIVLSISILLVSACSSSPDRSASDANETPIASATSTAVAPLVGRWEESAEVHTCRNYVRGMSQENLLAAVEDSPPVVSGERWQEVANDFCDPGPSDFGAVHSHFFDEFGNFGSVDQHEQQVDDGSYVIVDDHTMRIGKSATFGYDVTGNTLTLEPAITRSQRREALAKPGDFTEASWMVAVAFPGTSWHRVDCESWC